MTYISSQKKQLLDSVENQVLYADLLAVIVGEQGIGKSFFLEQLHHKLEDKVYRSQIDAEAIMTPQQLEKLMCMQLGLGWETSEHGILDKVGQSLDKRAVATFDNAHLLSKSCLDYLLTLVNQQHTTGETILFIILSGEIALAEKINETPTLRQNSGLCAVFQIKPFDQAETRHFIAWFQAVEEDMVDSLYQQKKIDQLWSLSRGNPKELEFQLEKWLDESSLNVRGVRPVSPKKHYLLSIIYAVVAIILLTALFFQDELNEIIMADSLAEDVAEEITVLSSTDSEQRSEDILPEIKEKAKKEIEEPAENKEVEVSESQVLETKIVQSSDKEKAVERENKQSLIIETTPIETVESVKATETVEQLSSEQESVINEAEKLEIIEVKEDKITQQNTVEIQPEIVRQEPITSIPVGLKLSNDEQLALSRKEQHFTIQWIGLSTLEAANGYRETHPLKSSMLIIRRPQNQSFLYLVISGDYAQKQEAENAKAEFILKGYTGSPWIKTYKMIHQDVNQLGQSN
ncbi:MAG: AAA family ATPase [Gammaproteobacteria bacterium]|nr:AAA family ATPase [Gammaproteobacteria bacterium]